MTQSSDRLEPTGNTRWRLSFVLMVTLFVAYLDRQNISLALPLIALEYGWTEAETREYGSLLFTLFYVGYGLANIFLSPLASRFGARKSLIFIIILWSLFTAMGAVFSQVMLLFAASRILLGLGEGVHFPMMNLLTKVWFPDSERSRANSIWIAGIYMAVLASPFILVPMMHAYGWRIGFFVLAAAGIVIALPLVLRFGYNTPEKCPHISDAEKAYIKDAKLGDAPEEEHVDYKVLLSGPFILILLIGMLNNLVSLGMANWLPTFFVTNKGVAYEDLMYLTSLPYIAGGLGLWIWSNIGDATGGRALLAGIGYLLVGLVIYISLVSTSVWLVAATFTLAVFFSSTYVATEFALVQRVLPANILGHASGIYNGLSTMIGGGLGPVVVSSIIGTDSDANIETLLTIPFICMLISLLLFTAYRKLRF